MDSINFPTTTDKELRLKAIAAEHINIVQAIAQLQNDLSFSTSSANNLYATLKGCHAIFVSLHGFARTSVVEKLSQEDKELIENFRKINFNSLLISDKSKPYSGKLSSVKNTAIIKQTAMDFIVLFDKYQDALHQAGLAGL